MRILSNERFRRVKRYTIASALLIVLGLVACGVFAARTALVYEERLQAMLQATTTCAIYIEGNNGAWPPGWDALSSVNPDLDVTWVSSHVDFDFAADPAHLVLQSIDEFVAISPRKPCFPAYDNRVRQILDLLKERHVRVEQDATRADH